MSLRFYFGPSGAGKSRQLYQEIMERSLKEPKKNFLIIVPDQFTMQTQKDLTMLHERGGILNIDVLSFGRLSHRIFDEVGELDTPVLDDTGKSLVLQKVALGMKDQLPTLGGHLHKQGYIHEVKSAISEFMQYGIAPADMPKLIAFSEKRGALVHKLKDLAVLYQGFKDYIQGDFITTEETLDVLRRSLSKSGLVKGSVVVFDGFTGFTPVQNRVIQEILCLSEETIVSLTLGEGENPYQPDGEQKLFHLTKKTVHDLEKLASQAGVQRGKDVFVKPGDRDRFAQSPALRALEQNLFRYSVKPYTDEQDSIHLMETTTPAEEVHQVGLKILELVRNGDMAYRDIALVSGDLEAYAPYVETEFSKMGIPCYIDRTRGIVLNPMTEYINSALELYLKNFTYEAVFHYLRSGLSDITAREADMLENYVIRTGVRGYSKWSRLFTHKMEESGEEEESLLIINNIRERLMNQIACLHGKSKDTVENYVNQLYEFLVANKVQEKLVNLEKMFTEQGDLAKAREYAQIYRLVMDLLNQIYELLGAETITLQEFADILEAGFGEIQVGTIPQNVDRILVGDMERTRLKQVKALFFLGVNDGNIPKSASKGGIISDMDREFLKESDMELAPSPRQQMFIQRLYLYLNMTKPSRYLYLSYAKVNREGRSIRPAYLVDVMKKLFPGLTVEYPQNRPMLDMVVTSGEGVDYLAQGLRLYVQGMSSPEEEQLFLTLYEAYGESAELKALREHLTKAAFKRYQESGLSKQVARALYGKLLENSVTRLETYAACAYHHFLQYGLSLKEREEFGFESVDMGNIFHAVLETFAERLAGSKYTWFDFPKEFGERLVREALEQYAAQYGETILYSSARNEYAITRMGRVLTRTVLTLQEQLKKGEFTPDAYEMSFHYADHLDSINVSLSPEEKMRLKGRIDRIDTAEDGEHVYVKVIDYKSGNRQFDLAALYYGLQLQLVVYMNAAMELEAKKHPEKEIVPAALLYYHIDDPTVETPTELSEEELNEQILEKLRMKGVVNGEEGIVEKLDKFMGSKSSIIPVERKKDGSFSARSSVMSSEELKIISDYVNYKVKNIGQEILAGKMELNPYEKGAASACTYCAYRKVCGFDPSVPGYEKRILEELDGKEALQRMKEAKQ
ncbi:MAG: helicase-exonuclease AddAB subunit AddB [Lachnospiraceae bacterium]|nr:helicase-exonuclease AddAB subunit AddB [Lachnospiraceae bacterium]